MLLQPKRTKFKKIRKAKIPIKTSKNAIQRGLKHTKFTLKYGEYGLITIVGARWHAKHIEAGRRKITRGINKKGRLWIRAFPDTPVTAKPTDARIGKGKGSLSHWVAKVRGGQILYEISGVREEEAKKALKSAANMIAFPTKIVKRIEFPKK